MPNAPKQSIRFGYTNYRGEFSIRQVKPVEITFRHTDFHPEDQWILRGWDYGKGDYRDFALVDCDFPMVKMIS